MKKIVALFALLVFLLAGCRKYDNELINGQSVDERLKAEIEQWDNLINDSRYGWILYVKAKGLEKNNINPTFAFYVKFNTDNTVTMFSDVDTNAVITPQHSGYRLVALQRPSLLFDTYSYIHLVCDPDPAKSNPPPVNGVYGAFGWGSDYEFSFADNVRPAELADTIRLKGNYNESEAMLVRATESDSVAYYSGKVKENMLFPNRIENYFRRTTAVNGIQYEIVPGGNRRQVLFNWIEWDGTTHQATRNIYYTPQGAFLDSALVSTTNRITSFTDIKWLQDANTSTILPGNISRNKFSFKMNGETDATLSAVRGPLKYDTGETERWFRGSAIYASYSGYHYKGKDDAFNITKLKDGANPFFTFIVGPGLTSDGFNKLDLFRPVFSDIANGGITVSESYYYVYSNFTYSWYSRDYYNNIFSGSYPFTQPAALNSTYNMLGGEHYIIKKDDNTWDMVSRNDERAWIQWSPLQ